MRVAPSALPRLSVLAAVLLSACGGEPVKLAEEAKKLEIEAPKSKGAQRYVIDATGGKLGFDMEAPVEKIRGRVPAGAVSGELFIDPTDITKTTGLVHVQLGELELFQRTAPEEGKEFGEETRSDTQNEHARAWLEISPDTPPDQLTRNSLVEFSLTEISGASATDLTKLTGAERKVTFTATGEFLLHQRKAKKSAKLEAVFAWAGDAPTGVTIRTLEPMEIGLDEYDVRPRTGFSKLAAKTLEAMSAKVAKFAEVNIELSAKLAADAKATMQSQAEGAAPAVPSPPAAATPAAADAKKPAEKTPAEETPAR